MHKRQNYSHPILYLFILIISFIGTLGCGEGAAVDCDCREEVCEACEEKIAKLEDRFYGEYLEEANGMFKLIEGFHQESRETGSAKATKDQVDMYFDMSSGLHKKVSQTRRGNKDLLTDLINIVSRGQANYYRLNANSTSQLERIDDREVGDVKVFVRNPVNYNNANNYAPLDTAVAAIVKKHDRQSIFITDGELARKNIPGIVDPSLAWALQPFTQWLKEGNRIDFVVLSYPNQERLFFIFFTPERIENQGGSIVDIFLEATADLKRNDSYGHLKFTINDYSLSKESDGRPKKENGVNSTFVDWVVDYEKKVVLDQGFEHIHIYDPESFYQYIDDFANGKFREDFQSKLDETNKLFYNLILTNEFINYQIANLDVQVEDISQPLQAYMDFLKCGQADTVRVVDEEGDKYVYWCNPYVSCEDTSHCQFGAAAAKGRRVAELFTLHEESVMEQGSNQFSTAKIAIRPAKNFNYNNWWETGALRINLYIQDVNYDEKKQDFELLKWPYKNMTNTGLSESIRLAMRELKPQNKLIYSYYFTYQM